MTSEVFDAVRAVIEHSDPLPLMAWATLYFMLLYIFFSSAVMLLSRALRRPLVAATIQPPQYTRELVNSARTIMIFGIGMFAPWSLVHLELAGITYGSPVSRIAIEFLVLVVWNDLHFYAMHRLLHTRLKQAHAAHHKSTTPTPYAAYSMSAIEAVLLGSVMPLAMLAHNFSVVSLVLLPAWSITINTLAHSNCDLFFWAKNDSVLQFVRRHQAHHSRYHGNFGFFFAQLDRWLGTTSSTPPTKHNFTLGG